MQTITNGEHLIRFSQSQLPQYFSFTDREGKNANLMSHDVISRLSSFFFGLDSNFTQTSSDTASGDTSGVGVSGGEYNAAAGDFIVAKNYATINLPSSPSNGNQIVVVDGDGTEIKIKSALKLIVDTTMVSLFSLGAALNFQYSLNDGVWWLR